MVKLFKAKKDIDHDFEKKIYESEITQELYQQLNELEARIRKLESRCLK
jgi:hypothetical protein